MELCKELADALTVYALSIEDEQQRSGYLDFVTRWQRRNHRETILKDAASVYPVELSRFDADPFLFNCLNVRWISAPVCFILIGRRICLLRYPESCMTQTSGVNGGSRSLTRSCKATWTKPHFSKRRWGMA